VRKRPEGPGREKDGGASESIDTTVAAAMAGALLCCSIWWWFVMFDGVRSEIPHLAVAGLRTTLGASPTHAAVIPACGGIGEPSHIAET
jgi:hypothetical protein